MEETTTKDKKKTRRIVQWVKRSPDYVAVIIFLLWFAGMHAYAAYMDYQVYKNSIIRSLEKSDK